MRSANHSELSNALLAISQSLADRSQLRAIVKCGVWRSCSRLLMSLHFLHSIDEANIFHYICEEFKTS